MFSSIQLFLYSQWKTELEEVIEAATLDSELWVSMIAETIKTFPTTGSLNTEISDYEETRPIFIEMVNDLKKYVNKHSDLGMLPLECQYLNKMALASVVCIARAKYMSTICRWANNNRFYSTGWTAAAACQTFHIETKTQKCRLTC